MSIPKDITVETVKFCKTVCQNKIEEALREFYAQTGIVPSKILLGGLIEHDDGRIEKLANTEAAWLVIKI